MVERLTRKDRDFWHLYEEEYDNLTIADWYEKLSKVEDIEEKLGITIEDLADVLTYGLIPVDRDGKLEPRLHVEHFVPAHKRPFHCRPLYKEVQFSVDDIGNNCIIARPETK